MDQTAAATLFAWLDREIWLVTSQANGHRGGMIASFVCQVSLIPDMPRVLVGLSKDNSTGSLIETSRTFALHMLSLENMELVWRFGLDGNQRIDPFFELPSSASPSGNPLLEQTIGWLDCQVETSLDVGDRTVYVAEVVEGRVINFAPPLTTGKLMELAPSSRLVQLQRARHHQCYNEAQALRAWRESHVG